MLVTFELRPEGREGSSHRKGEKELQAEGPASAKASKGWAWLVLCRRPCGLTREEGGRGDGSGEGGPDNHVHRFDSRVVGTHERC